MSFVLRNQILYLVLSTESSGLFVIILMPSVSVFSDASWKQSVAWVIVYSGLLSPSSQAVKMAHT
jgi:hypothetical protein